MLQGTIKFFNETQGYGFIVPEEGGEDIFFHVSAVKDKEIAHTDKGRSCDYEIGESRKKGKTEATKVVVV